jgi:formylmethanofuran dehydrogenase subunit E
MTRRIGNVVIIEKEEDRRCELCGEIAETRPYGPKGERVCFDCAKKDPAAMERGARKMFGDPPIQ